MDTAIHIENVSKLYRLGNIGTGTIHGDLKRWWAQVRGKEDPFAIVGVSNNLAVKNENDYVWALQDINLEIKQGDVIGIIGKNGAGKSTLLKILSRVTTPTTGQINIHGRIASLLEVGTGFHPELTGRENIFLNGAILGMTKSEIRSKFDEIVDFAGVERYIDTPVKRFSSGMYVRLAFAVAAHLEPEILIVDEVLAVGDAEFQKKAIGKMKDISAGQGRTVLFVSHNMAAIQNLCNKGILMNNGIIAFSGEIGDVISKYLLLEVKKNKKISDIHERSGNGTIRFTNAEINGENAEKSAILETFSNVTFELEFVINETIKINTANIAFAINNHLGDRIAWMSTETVGKRFEIAKNKICFAIQNFPLAPGDYNCNIFCEINGEIADWLMEVLPFSVIEKDYYGTGKTVPSNQGDILLQYSVLTN